MLRSIASIVPLREQEPASALESGQVFRFYGIIGDMPPIFSRSMSEDRSSWVWSDQTKNVRNGSPNVSPYASILYIKIPKTKYTKQIQEYLKHVSLWIRSKKVFSKDVKLLPLFTSYKCSTNTKRSVMKHK